MNIAKTLAKLKDIQTITRPGKVDWAKEDAWAVDAIRGSVHETGWRGTLTGCFTNEPLQFELAVKRAMTRLKSLPNVDWPYKQTYLARKIGLGTYGWKYDPKIIHRAVELGIKFIDTAESYGYGRVEEELGCALKPLGHKAVVLATKVARNHMSYQSVMNAAERSLEKLGYIGLYQVHRPNPFFPIDATMRAMGHLYMAGAFEGIGVSNFSIDQIVTAQHALQPHANKQVVLRSVQVRYNLMDRGVERALLPWCQDNGITVIAYSPLGQKFSTLRMDALDYIAIRYAAKPAQIALAWLMTHPGVLPIPRTNNLKHLDEIADSVNIKLDIEHIVELQEAYPIKE